MEDVKLFVLLALLAVAGFLHPAAGLVAAIAFSFFASGYLLLRASGVRLDGLQTIVFSAIASVLFSSFVVYFVSLAFGYSRLTVSACFAAISLLALVGGRSAKRVVGASSNRAFLPGLKDAVRCDLLGVIKENRTPFLCAAFVFVAVLAVLGFSLWKVTPQGIVNGGWNWSDFLVHLSIIQSVNAGNFPPQAPFFAGAPLVYHWFSDFHTAFNALLGGVFPVPLVLFEQAFYAALLFLSAFILADFFVKNRKVALLAAFLVLFGGGLGYLKFFGDAQSVSPLELIKQNSYDNNWAEGWGPYKIPSVWGTVVLTHRASSLAFPALLMVLFLLASAAAKQTSRTGGLREERTRGGGHFFGLGNSRQFLLAGLLGGMIAPFNYFAFIALVAVAGLLLLFTASREGKAVGLRVRAADAGRCGSGKGLLLFFVVAFLVALPFALPAIGKAQGMAKLVAGWDYAPKDVVGAAWFYVANFGVPFVLALAALFFCKTAWKKFLLAWMAVLFLIPNLFSFSAISWDMSKFFAFMWFPVCLLAAMLLAKLLEAGRESVGAASPRAAERRYRTPVFFCRGKILLCLGRLALAVALLASVLSPVLVSAWFVEMDWVALSHDDVNAADWIAANTPGDAVFVTESNINMPTDLAGRKRLTTFPPYLENYGLDARERTGDVQSVFCSSAGEAAGVLRKYGASFVLSRGEYAECGHAFAASPLFEKVFSSGNVKVYELVG